MTVIGFKAYMSGGQVMQANDWEQLPDVGIQVLVVYYAETFPIWQADHEEKWNYKDVLQGFDYYWRAPDGKYGCTAATDIPEGAAVKRTGLQLADDAWMALYNRALNDEVW
jgi:hypothetical protein